jgi:hypothetical protein
MRRPSQAHPPAITVRVQTSVCIAESQDSQAPSKFRDLQRSSTPRLADGSPLPLIAIYSLSPLKTPLVPFVCLFNSTRRSRDGY